MSANPGPLYITFTVIDSLVLTTTLLRLSVRLHIRRFWWEDAWAAAAFVFGTAFVITQYITVQHADPQTGIIICLIASVFSTIALCAVRMSILYSSIRIMSPSSHIRIFARIVAIFLFISSATSIALRSASCLNIIPPNATSDGTQSVKCVSGIVNLVFQVATDCISDAALVVIPLKLLWRVKLPRRQRRMILSSFSSSAIVSIFSLSHGISQGFVNNYATYNLTLNLETTSALIVCNLLVLVTYVYRLFRKSSQDESVSESDDSLEDDDFTTRTPARRTTEALTSVDLDIDASYSGVHSDVSSSSHSLSATAEKNGDN